MDKIVSYAFESGALNNIILSVLLIWLMYFITTRWWPDKTVRMDRQQNIDRDLRMREIDAETEIKKLEIEAQIDIYKQVIKDMSEMKMSIDGLRATFNDFLQNILSQFIEDRRELVDTGIFKTRGSEK